MTPRNVYLWGALVCLPLGRLWRLLGTNIWEPEGVFYHAAKGKQIFLFLLWLLTQCTEGFFFYVFLLFLFLMTSSLMCTVPILECFTSSSSSASWEMIDSLMLQARLMIYLFFLSFSLYFLFYLCFLVLLSVFHLSLHWVSLFRYSRSESLCPIIISWLWHVKADAP